MGSISLRRYSNLAATIHLLRSKCLTLLSPTLWDDRNDAFYMAEYKKRKKAKCLVAVCMTSAPETYHHWQVFAPGTDGVCIQFDKDRLAAQIPPRTGFRLQSVDYRPIAEVENDQPRTQDLPFIKRLPYEDEKEFRLIFSSSVIEADTHDLPIDLGCIQRVTLSPWMPRPLAQSVKETLRELLGCEGLAISRSSLIENERWKRAANPELEVSD
jgi:hypothetical protein